MLTRLNSGRMALSFTNPALCDWSHIKGITDFQLRLGVDVEVRYLLSWSYVGVKGFLPVGESNPGLPRDRRGY